MDRLSVRLLETHQEVHFEIFKQRQRINSAPETYYYLSLNEALSGFYLEVSLSRDSSHSSSEVFIFPDRVITDVSPVQITILQEGRSGMITFVLTIVLFPKINTISCFSSVPSDSWTTSRISSFRRKFRAGNQHRQSGDNWRGRSNSSRGLRYSSE